MTDTIKLQPSLIPYYYTKSSEPIFQIGVTPAVDAIVAHAVENKNPLNRVVPMSTFQKTELGSYYHFPMPFFFSLAKYDASATEGVSLFRVAKEFWAAVDEINPGFKVFAASLFVLPPGQKTPRLPDNPGGPQGPRWYAGGSRRVLVPLAVAPGATFTYGQSVFTPEVNTAYEVNNLLIHQVINNSASDLIFLEIDLAPWDKIEELESRILLDPVLKEIHVANSAGYPAHTTVFL